MSDSVMVEHVERGRTTAEAIRHRAFGRTDLIVSEFGLGCARIGGVFKSDPAGFVSLLSRAFEGGITFFDTADIYSQGESETLVGRAFRKRRDKVVIASKAGYVLPSQRRVANRLKPLLRPVIGLLGLSRDRLPAAVRGSLTQNFSPTYLAGAVEGSLRRLGTDYLDLLQLHSPPYGVVEQGEWIAGLESLKQQGKIRYYGISCDGPEAAHAALAHPGVTSLQLPISLLERTMVPIAARARTRGVAVIARECLANGLLVKPEQDAAASPLAGDPDTEAAARAVEIREYRRWAGEAGCTLPQVALKFVSGLEGVSVTLVGVSRIEQLEALLADGLRLPGDRPLSIPNFATAGTGAGEA